jgi:alanine-synthesizing transaminase
VPPGGAIYAFPWIRADAITHFDDTAFALRLLDEEGVLLVPGTSFNLTASRHLRLTLLPEPAQLAEVFTRMDRVLGRMASEDRPATASAVA